MVATVGASGVAFGEDGGEEGRVFGDAQLLAFEHQAAEAWRQGKRHESPAERGDPA